MLASCVVSFKRVSKKTGVKAEAWEDGIAVLSSPGTSDICVLIDNQGRIVPSDDVYDYIRSEYRGCFVLVGNS